MNTIRDDLGFEKLAELGDCLIEVFLVITGHALKFTDYNARHHQGNADPWGQTSRRSDSAKRTDSELAGTVEPAEG